MNQRFFFLHHSSKVWVIITAQGQDDVYYNKSECFTSMKIYIPASYLETWLSKN